MYLTEAEIFSVARQGNFQVEVFLGLFTGDSRIIMGNGVDDINRIIRLIANGTNAQARLQIDVNATGIVGFAPQWRRFDISDLERIRTKYISLWGPVNKPNEFRLKPGVDFPVPVKFTA